MRPGVARRHEEGEAPGDCLLVQPVVRLDDAKAGTKPDRAYAVVATGLRMPAIAQIAARDGLEWVSGISVMGSESKWLLRRR